MDGMFELQPIPEGTYTLEVTFIGFIPLEKSLQVNDDILKLGSLLLKSFLVK